MHNQPHCFPLPVVILSTADMDAPVWTNKQHIATRLVGDREVHYIESLGLRAPSLSGKDFVRVIKRLAFIFRRRKPVESSRSKPKSENGSRELHLHAPIVLPLHAFAFIRLLNNALISLRISRRLPRRYALWTFSPLTYGLEARADSVVYHSVDLLHTIPGIPSNTLLTAERQLIARADAVIASSEGVSDHLRRQGASPLLWENVADIALFEQMRAPANERVRRAIFAGNLTPSKINFRLLEAIVAGGTRLALAGPFNIDGTKRHAALDRLMNSPLVEYLGTLSQEKMAQELGRSWVGIIPYHVNEYTAGVFPMKVYEYLGSGLPVITTPLRSIVGRSIPSVTVTEEAVFSAAVKDMCENEYTPPIGGVGENSWDSRLAQILCLLDQHEEVARKNAI